MVSLKWKPTVIRLSLLKQMFMTNDCVLYLGWDVGPHFSQFFQFLAFCKVPSVLPN